MLPDYSIIMNLAATKYEGLFFGCSREQSIARLKSATANIRDVNAITDEAGNTPLHLAVEAGASELIALLIHRGADIHQQNNAKKSPLELARSFDFDYADSQSKSVVVFMLREETNFKNKLAGVSEVINYRLQKLKALKDNLVLSAACAKNGDYKETASGFIQKIHESKEVLLASEEKLKATINQAKHHFTRSPVTQILKKYTWVSTSDVDSIVNEAIANIDEAQPLTLLEKKSDELKRLYHEIDGKTQAVLDQKTFDDIGKLQAAFKIAANSWSNEYNRVKQSLSPAIKNEKTISVKLHQFDLYQVHLAKSLLEVDLWIERINNRLNTNEKFALQKEIKEVRNALESKSLQLKRGAEDNEKLAKLDKKVEVPPIREPSSELTSSGVVTNDLPEFHRYAFRGEYEAKLLSKEMKIELYRKKIKKAYKDQLIKDHKPLATKFQFNPDEKDNLNRTPYMLAIANGKRDIATHLVDKYGASLNAQDNHGQTALMLATRAADVETVKSLLKTNASNRTVFIKDLIHLFNDEKSDLKTQFSHLCQKHRITDVSLQDHKEGLTALMIAVVNKRDDIMIALLDEIRAWNAEIALVVKPYIVNTECLRPKLEEINIRDGLLINSIDLNATDKYGRTALHLACGFGSTDTVKSFLHYLTDIMKIDADEFREMLNLKDSEGNTPLMIAAARGRKGIVELLLSKEGLEVNAVNKAGYSARDLSIYFRKRLKESREKLHLSLDAKKMNPNEARLEHKRTATLMGKHVALEAEIEYCHGEKKAFAERKQQAAESRSVLGHRIDMKASHASHCFFSSSKSLLCSPPPYSEKQSASTANLNSAVGGTVIVKVTPIIACKQI